MSKRKDATDTAPAHVTEWNTLENRIAAAEEFAQQVRDDALADVLTGKPIEDARIMAVGLAHEDKSERGGKGSGKARRGEDSKMAFILAEAARYQGPVEAMVNTIVSRYAVKMKHTEKMTPRYVRQVLTKRKTEL